MRKKLSLLLFALIAITAFAAQALRVVPTQLYVIGDMTGWTRTNMHKMTYNEKTKAFEYSFSASRDKTYFAFADYQMTEEEAESDPNWDRFNSEFRWSIGAGDHDASSYVDGEAVQLGKDNGSLSLNEGTYFLSIDPSTMMLTISTSKPFEYDNVFVAGNGKNGGAWMNGISWDPAAELNKMTKVDGTDDVWEITFKDVPANDDYQFKFTVDGTWDVNFGGDFIGYGIETPAEFNSSNNITFGTTAETQDVTLRIDLSNYDNVTNQGATFTVIAPAEKNAYVVAGCVGNNGETGAGEDDMLFGKTWDGTSEANQLALNEESGLYTLTYKAVAFEDATEIYFKVVLNGKKWIPDGPNQTCEIPAAGEYDIVVTYNPETDEITMKAVPFVDIVVNPEDITDGDITKALSDKIASYGEDVRVKNITINLAEGEAYTLSATIKGAYDITINGNGATIDASNGDNIVAIDKVNAFAKKSDGSDSDHSYVSAITFKDVTIKGMKKALIRDLMTKTLLETLTIDNCVMEVSDQKPFIDFDGRGYVGKVVVKNSTIWAAAPTNKNFAKYGSRPKNVDEAFNQEFDIQNSTFVNIAPKPDFSGGQNLNNLKQTGTANNIYTLKNSIFVNTGKSGQVVTGFNGGQVSATPVWDVDANVFNWNGADVSANEVSKAGKKDNEDIVKNSHAGIIEFTDAANGDFNGRFTAAPVKEDAEESSRASEVATLLNCGDPRWTIEWKQGYAINIDAKFGDVTTNTVGYAAEGDEVTITAKPNPADKFELVSVKVEGVNSDLEVEVTPDEENPEKFTFTMPADAVIVSATFRRIAVDIIVNPEDIEAGDIAAALDAKIASYDYTDPKTEEIIPVRVKNIYIILTPGESYTLTKTLTAPNNIMLVGATEEGDELAVINVAEGVTADVITLDGTEKLATKADGTLTDHKRINLVAITGVAVYDLQGAVVKDIQKTQLEVLAIHNAIIQMPDAQKNVIDFSGKGYVANAIVQNSTIYAEKKNTGFFAQYGSRPKNIDGNDASLKQAFIVQNSTFANIANSKNFCDLKQKGTAQNEFTIKNNIFTDCGKNGQTVVGFDGGQSSAAPQWDVDGNVFNWGGLDTSAAETTKAGQKDGEDIVKNSLACRVEFADIAEPDLGGRMILAPGVEAPESMPGDPRWTLTTAEGFNITVIVSKDGTGSASAEYTYAAEGDEVGLTTTPAEGYEIEAIVMTDADGKLLDSVDGDSFVMPGEDVIIIVTYTKTTGIDDVTTAESEEGAWFTIKGIRIDKPVQKGLYIHNGKKVVIK